MILSACAHIGLYLRSPENFKIDREPHICTNQGCAFFIIGKLPAIISTAANVPAGGLSKRSIRESLTIIGKPGSAGNKTYKNE